MVDSFSDGLINESTDVSPTHVYGLSKLQAEQAIQNHSSAALKYIFRPVLIYGPGQKGNLQLLEKLIDYYCPIPLKNWKNQRSLMYIENLNAVIHACMKKEIDGGIYLLADDQSISTYAIIDQIAKGKNKKVMGFRLPNSFFKFVLRLAPNKIKLMLNKILGSLAVDNQKIKSALQIHRMPFTTQEGFAATYKLNNN